jgi:hypothetical protein
MSSGSKETRASGQGQVFEFKVIDDPVEQERLNRELRRPGDRWRVQRWLPRVVLVAALVLAGFLGFLLRGLL